MPLTPKLKRYFEAKRDPTMLRIREMDGWNEASKRLLSATEENTKLSLKSFYDSLAQSINEFVQTFPDIARTVGEQITKEMREYVERELSDVDKYRGPQGNPPSKEELTALIKPLIPPPIKGERGNPGKTVEGKPGITPIPGLDFPTEEEIKTFIKKEIPKEDFFTKLVTKLLKTIEFKPPTIVAIARGLEKLKGKERLDYYKLKNLPDLAEREGQRNIYRGASMTVQYYDLTSQCNGVLKTFTIPSNKRVLAVFGSQFPINYRPLIDWTVSGTTLTLTAEVSAPETTQTLYILYIA